MDRSAPVPGVRMIVVALWRQIIISTVVRGHLVGAHRVRLARLHLILDVRTALIGANWRLATETGAAPRRICIHVVPGNFERLAFADVLGRRVRATRFYFVIGSALTSNH